MAGDAAGEYGGFWIRFLAYVADCAIVFMLVVLLAAVFGVTGMVVLGNIAIFLLQLLYWPVMQASARQATFGKAMLGLKVVGSEDNRISFLRSLGRELAKILSALTFMVGFVMAAFTGKKQALHDLLASTTVVRAGEARIGRALAVSVAGFVVPIVAIGVLGASLFAGMLGAGMQDMDELRREMEKQQAEATRKAAPPAVTAKAAPTPAAPAASPPPTQVATAPSPQPAVPPKPEAPPAPKPVAEAPSPSPKAEPVAAAASTPPPSRPATAAAPRAEPSQAAARLAALEEAPPLPSSRPGPAASTLRHNDLMSAVLARDAGAVEALLRLGRWPDKADTRGVTPLMAAAQYGDARSVELLLKAGANPNASAGGETAASLARQRGHYAVVDLLQRHGAR